MQNNIYLNDMNGYKSFKEKSYDLKKLINEALHILDEFGIPLKGTTPRTLEMMALSFLAVVDVKSSNEWSLAKDQTQQRFMKTRDIIYYVNEHFGENISAGSYDDIRRKFLKLPVLATVLVNSEPNSARNAPTRGYTLNKDFSSYVRNFGSIDWGKKVRDFMSKRGKLSENLNPERNVTPIPIVLPSGLRLSFTIGEHNELQKAIIEEFLPIYGYGAEVLYIGDTADKYKVLEKEKLDELGFFEIAHGELPDVVAYSREKNWLYLIEAVHSSGPISPARKFNLEQLLVSCQADVVFVTAFLNKETFRRFLPDIAWETEVWVADNPTHLIHFNGHKFLGPFPTEH